MKKGRFIQFLVIIVFMFHPVSSYFITGDIFILDSGTSRLDLSSDLNEKFYDFSFNNGKLKVSTDELTSKSKEVWTFQLNLPNLSSTFIEIHLPSNLRSIVKIEGKGYLLDLDKKTLTILNPKSSILISYNLEDSKSYSFLIYLFVVLLLIAIYFIYRRSRKRKEHLLHIMPLINENEQKIIDLLIKSPKRQKEIRSLLNIPKASFTRYIINLEKKKLIFREGEGKNKVLKLK